MTNLYSYTNHHHTLRLPSLSPSLTHSSPTTTTTSISPNPLAPQDFTRYLLMTGYLRNIVPVRDEGETEGEDSERRRKRVWGEWYDEVVIEWLESSLRLGLEKKEVTILSSFKYRELIEGLRRVEVETEEGGGKGKKPSEYLHDQLTTSLDPTTFLTLIQDTHQLIKDSVNSTSIFGNFLHHFHTTIDYLAFDQLIKYLDSIRDYLREGTESEGNHSNSTIVGGAQVTILPNFIPSSTTSNILWDETTRQSLAQSPDLESSIRIMEHYANLTNLTRETQSHFIKFVQAVVKKDFEESLNQLRHFSRDCITRNSHYHPYALLNLGFLHYRFQYYQQSAKYFLDSLQLASRTNHTPDCSYYSLIWLAYHHNLPGHPTVHHQIAHLLGKDWYPSLLEYLVNQYKKEMDFVTIPPLELLLRHQLATSSSPETLLTTLSLAPPPSAPLTESSVWSHLGFPTLATATLHPEVDRPDHLS